MHLPRPDNVDLMALILFPLNLRTPNATTSATNMSLLFRTFFLTALFGMFFHLSDAQNVKRLGYKWKETKPTETIERYKNEDAYIVRSDIDVTNSFVWTNRMEHRSFKSERRRIKFLTRKGVEEFASVVYSFPVDYELEALDARTIKSNGEIEG